MPYSDFSVVLNSDVIGERESEVRKVLMRLFPGAVLVSRHGKGSASTVLDVLMRKVDGSAQETYLESCGNEVALTFESMLSAELQR